MTVADAKNCRILFLDAAGAYDRQIGTNGTCSHGMPATVGYPNGDTPLPNGHLLVSELNGAWVSEVTATGHVVWTHQIPGLVEPSDPQQLADGTYLVASYASPGAVIRFDRSGKVLWYYHPASGPGMLDHPSLAMPLPNGLVAVNDDYHHRVVLIDPRTDEIVWQYGTGSPGSGPGQLSFPDGMDLMLPGNRLPLHVDFATHVGARGPTVSARGARGSIATAALAVVAGIGACGAGGGAQDATSAPPGALARSTSVALPTTVTAASTPDATASPRAQAGSDAGNVYAGITDPTLAPAVRGIPTRVYVPDNDSNDVRVIDPRTFRVVRTFPVGREPQHITPSWDLRHLYAGNVYSNSLTEIDPKSGRPVRTISVPDPVQPLLHARRAACDRRRRGPRHALLLRPLDLEAPECPARSPTGVRTTSTSRPTAPTS